MHSIFVTVGSTSFASLTTAVFGSPFLEAAKQAGYDLVVVQYGRGSLPVGLQPDGTTVVNGISVRPFSFSSEIEEEVDSSDVVISHAGSASIISALRAGKQLIVVPNTTLADNHQVELADALEKERYLAVATPETLVETLISLPSRTFRPFPAFRPKRFGAIMDDLMGFETGSR